MRIYIFAFICFMLIFMRDYLGNRHGFPDEYLRSWHVPRNTSVRLLSIERKRIWLYTTRIFLRKQLNFEDLVDYKRFIRDSS